MQTTSLSENATLKQARDWLRNRLGKGAECPCCGQRAQMYKRKITRSMILTAAAVLARQRQTTMTGEAEWDRGSVWVYLPSIPQRSRDFSTLAFFDLVEQRPGKRDDGGAAGWWRVTHKGREFLEGRTTVSKYVKVFDGKRYGWSGDEQVSVTDIAPRFRFDHLMEGV